MNALKERQSLLRSRRWLEDTVIPGYERQGDHRSVEACWQQIADINWRLEVDPPRPVPNMNLTLPYRERQQTTPKQLKREKVLDALD